MLALENLFNSGGFLFFHNPYSSVTTEIVWLFGAYRSQTILEATVLVAVVCDALDWAHNLTFGSEGVPCHPK